MYDEMVTVGEIRRRHLEVAVHVLEGVAASRSAHLGPDLDAVERAAVALRQVLDQERSEKEPLVELRPDINLLNEISDDPFDEESDYGRGFAAGREDAAREIAEACEVKQARAHDRSDEVIGGTLDMQATWAGAARLARKVARGERLRPPEASEGQAT